MSTREAGVPEIAAPETADEAADGGWKRTSPLGILVLGARAVQQAILPVIAIMFGSQVADSGPGLALLIGGAIIGFNLLFAALAWWRTRYRIGSSDIRVHKGVVSRQARSVPFERIQDVSLEQGPVARLLGLVEVRFETGAGGKDELQLAYVTADEGAALQETVRGEMGQSEVAQNEVAPSEVRADQAAGGGADPAMRGAVRADGADVMSSGVASSGHAPSAPLFAMGPGRLLLFGMFEFSLVVFAVLAGAAQQFEALLPFDIWNMEDWEARLAGSSAFLASFLAGFGLLARVIAIALVLAALGLIGLATGIARTFAREYGFRLDRTPTGFRRRRGLFTRTDVVMPVHRVQAVTVSTGWLRRRGGWHGLSFISLAQDAGSANHAVAPFAQPGEIAPIARAAGFDLPGTFSGDLREADGGWLRASQRYRIDRAVLSSILPAAAGCAGLIMGLHWLAVGGLLAALALTIRHYFLWRHEGYALDSRQVLSRRGWLAPRLIVASRVKLHSVEIRQGPLARRHGYADLRFGLAGGRLSLNGLALSDARSMRDAVLASIAPVDFSDLPARPEQQQ